MTNKMNKTQTAILESAREAAAAGNQLATVVRGALSNAKGAKRPTGDAFATTLQPVLQQLQDEKEPGSKSSPYDNLARVARRILEKELEGYKLSIKAAKGTVSVAVEEKQPKGAQPQDGSKDTEATEESPKGSNEPAGGPAARNLPPSDLLRLAFEGAEDASQVSRLAELAAEYAEQAIERMVEQEAGRKAS